MNETEIWRYLFVAAMVTASLVSGARILAERAWNRERSRLLDRIMARDYREYVALAQEPVEPKRLTESERKALAESERLADAAHGIV